MRIEFKGIATAELVEGDFRNQSSLIATRALSKASSTRIQPEPP